MNVPILRANWRHPLSLRGATRRLGLQAAADSGIPQAVGHVLLAASTRKQHARYSAGLADLCPMRSSNFDVRYEGLKVATIHASKGLQFPIVVVTGLEEGVLPRAQRRGAEDDEHMDNQRRLLFVGASRAMRHLAFCRHAERPSRFLADLDETQWQVLE